MARGIEQYLEDIEQIGTDYKFRFRVYLAGADVPPEGTYTDFIVVTMTASDTLATFEGKRATAIRALASGIGATIAANQVLLISFRAA